MINFFLLVNKYGQTRLSQYYEHIETKERVTMEGEIVRKCVSRADDQVSLFPNDIQSLNLISHPFRSLS